MKELKTDLYRSVKLERTPAVDIEAYLVQICYKGDRTPTLETLQAIHKQHMQTIAFENLNSFLKQPVPLT